MVGILLVLSLVAFFLVDLLVLRVQKRRAWPWQVARLDSFPMATGERAWGESGVSGSVRTGRSGHPRVSSLALRPCSLGGWWPSPAWP